MKVSATVTYPVSASSKVDFLRADAGYRVYKDGKSGATEDNTVTSGQEKTVEVINGIPYYKAHASKSFSRRYVVRVTGYGYVTFTDGTKTISISSSTYYN